MLTIKPVINPTDMERYVLEFKSKLGLSDYVTLEALTKALSDKFNMKISFITDSSLFARGTRSGIYPIHYLDEKNVELNIDISEQSYAEYQNEENILEKIKTYRIVYTLGILIFHTRSHGEGIDWKDTNYDMKDLYGNMGCYAVLVWFLPVTNAGLFATTFLIPETLKHEFHYKISLIEDSKDQQLAVNEMANLCSVPIHIMRARISDLN